MKIIVSIKQVPDTSGKVAVNPDGTLNRASMHAAYVKCILPNLKHRMPTSPFV